MPTGDHMWHAQFPRNSPKTFFLSRSNVPDYKYQLIESPVIGEYRFITHHESLTKELDAFPKTGSVVEVNFKLNESMNVASVKIIAPNGLGDWTTLPVKDTWGIGVVKKNGVVLNVINKGVRERTMKLHLEGNISLWFPDNGNLSKCPELKVIFLLNNGETINTIADCSSNPK
jgi:hypothetical protein